MTRLTAWIMRHDGDDPAKNWAAGLVIGALAALPIAADALMRCFA